MITKTEQLKRKRLWHSCHMAQLKRRKHLRVVHMLANRIETAKKIEIEKKTQEQIDNPKMNEHKRNWLSWFFLRTYWVITDFFRRVARSLKTKNA